MRKDLSSILFNYERRKLFIKLRFSIAFVCDLDGLTKVKTEDAEDGLAVYLVSATLEVNVAFKADENIHERINIVYFTKMNFCCYFLILRNLSFSLLHIATMHIIYQYFSVVNTFIDKHRDIFYAEYRNH